MSALKCFVLIVTLVFCSLAISVFAQERNFSPHIKTDTFRIRYLIWDTDSLRSKPVFIQKDGYIIKFHTDEHKNMNFDERQDIMILDDKKRIEKLPCLRYIFL